MGCSLWFPQADFVTSPCTEAHATSHERLPSGLPGKVPLAESPLAWHHTPISWSQASGRKGWVWLSGEIQLSGREISAVTESRKECY